MNMPDKWLKQEQQTDKIVSNSPAGFSEYIRWMRSPLPEIDSNNDFTKDETKKNKKTNNQTKLQILQFAADKSKNYKDRLKQNNERTELIAGKDNTFIAECPYRMRVGGETGTENILLPAFDSFGMPYISSSSLRGVARSQAFWEISQKYINELIQQNGNINNEQIKKAKQRTEQEVSTYFGSLDIAEEHRMGKVIFLDAYPLHSKWGLQGKSLALDIATNIWGWENGEPNYSPNPNAFLSLNQPEFLIGLRPLPRVDITIFNKIKGWLIRGLQNGIGSQVNSGYGEMIIKDQPSSSQPILQLDFTIQGQLIHGVQRYKNLSQPFLKRDGQLQTDRNGNLREDTYPEPEVRAIAFKSMLRYWFRTLALGYLPANVVQHWESQLFGAIQPQQKQGWIKCQLNNIVNTNSREQTQNTPCLTQKGTLKLNFSREIEESKKENVTKLMTNLTWLMFHLGGVGQGARRPLYSRKNRDNPRPPYYRGCDLRVNNNDKFWNLPENIVDFQNKFNQILRDFYRNLSQVTGNNFNVNNPVNVNNNSWREAIDANCRIIICSGNENNDKPHALAILHSNELNPNKPIYNPDLCGKSSDRSPVWISNLGKYQVVTVFGANQNPRNQNPRNQNPRNLFIQSLIQGTDNNKYYQIFPLN